MISTKQTMWRANRTGEPKRRHMLKEILPLEVPLSLDIEASSRCCLKCRYCPQSLSDAKKKELNLCTGGTNGHTAVPKNCRTVECCNNS